MCRYCVFFFSNLPFHHSISFALAVRSLFVHFSWLIPFRLSSSTTCFDNIFVFHLICHFVEMVKWWNVQQFWLTADSFRLKCFSLPLNRNLVFFAEKAHISHTHKPQMTFPETMSMRLSRMWMSTLCIWYNAMENANHRYTSQCLQWRSTNDDMHFSIAKFPAADCASAYLSLSLIFLFRLFTIPNSITSFRNRRWGNWSFLSRGHLNRPESSGLEITWLDSVRLIQVVNGTQSASNTNFECRMRDRAPSTD